jgi:CDP-glucose 4,6-dehydratase
MEGVEMIDKRFWKNRRILITGHTGFKGSWLCTWLNKLGAEIIGYSLPPPTNPSLFDLANVEQCVKKHIIGDVRDHDNLVKVVQECKPEIVIHMAAQPIVRDSYKNPVDTYAINVMGTVNLLDAVRLCPGIKAVVNVTTDKCYENREWVWGYRENEPMGGYDPYSNSKGCSELVTLAFRSSFFNPKLFNEHGVALASARAGNVIGGGDWASDRLIPDCIKAILCEEVIKVRNPKAIRPWQHVLEPLSGYLLLCQKLCNNEGVNYAEGWNFGPKDSDTFSVEQLIKILCKTWGGKASYINTEGAGPHEASFLKLDCSKAQMKLGWQPRWNTTFAVTAIVDWTKCYVDGKSLQLMCSRQIDQYEDSAYA